MSERTPKHVALIMDGNGRWARKRFQPRLLGHRAGRKTAENIIEAAARAGVEVLTLFAFGQENWARPAEEVTGLMRILLETFEFYVEKLQKNQIRLHFIGDRTQLSSKLIASITAAEELTKDYTRMRLQVAFNYSGQWDIVQATQKLAQAVARGELNALTIDAHIVSQHLVTADVPDPDLLIRTGGASRISNFMLWQMAYTECYFTDIFWPDFTAKHFQQALDFFAKQERRFGKTSEQVGQ